MLRSTSQSYAACHEASHAVIAVHLRIPISRVRIGHDDPKYGGEVEITPKVRVRQIRAFPMDKDGVVRVDVKTRIKELDRKRVEKIIMMLCAGDVGPFALGYRVKGDRGNGSDEAYIKELQKKFGICDRRVARLRLRVSRILQDPFIQASILLVSKRLLEAPDGIVPAKETRAIYRRIYQQRTSTPARGWPRIKVDVWD